MTSFDGYMVVAGQGSVSDIVGRTFADIKSYFM